MKRILIVMAKAPVAGQSKTRLAGAIGFDGAAALYRCLLLDTLDVVRQVPGVECAVAYSPRSAEGVFRVLAPDMVRLPQVGADLGERLDMLVTAHLEAGYGQVGVLSSDAPLVEPAVIAQGFAALERGYDVALGPCDDGGYYLLATHVRCSAMFREVEMSTPSVAAETRAIAEREGLRVVLLPMSYDVDVPADLDRLRAGVAAAPASRAGHTRLWLSENGSRLLEM